MNQKKAKAIRGLVKQLVARGVIKGPWTEYGTVTHVKKINDLVLDDEGNKVPGKREINTHSRVVNPNCARGVYLRMKKHGPMAVLGGVA